MNCPPVIFIAFNRPAVTARTWERIRAARPAQLLLVCDGPRPGRPGEAEAVAAVRRLLAEGVDWPCTVHRNFSDVNLGCRRRVVSGLDWAFSLVPEAIVLEDDCRPHPSFFAFCAHHLAAWRDDARVKHINGTNLAPRPDRTGSRFSRHAWMWGWATWARAWREYDGGMSGWETRRALVDSTFATRHEAAFWRATFAHALPGAGPLDTWDFPWLFTVRARDGLVIMPERNLVENLGFAPDATHTTRAPRHRYNQADDAGPLLDPPAETIPPWAEEAFTRAYREIPATPLHRLTSLLRILRDRPGRSRFPAHA